MFNSCTLHLVQSSSIITLNQFRYKHTFVRTFPKSYQISHPAPFCLVDHISASRALGRMADHILDGSAPYTGFLLPVPRPQVTTCTLRDRSLFLCIWILFPSCVLSYDLDPRPRVSFSIAFIFADKALASFPAKCQCAPRAVLNIVVSSFGVFIC